MFTTNKNTSDLFQSVLPKKWHYYVSIFRKKGTRFKAEIYLSTVNTILNLHEWIRTFSVINNCTYRRSSTKRSTRGFTAYSVRSFMYIGRT